VPGSGRYGGGHVDGEGDGIGGFGILGWLEGGWFLLGLSGLLLFGTFHITLPF